MKRQFLIAGMIQDWGIEKVEQRKEFYIKRRQIFLEEAFLLIVGRVCADRICVLRCWNVPAGGSYTGLG